MRETYRYENRRKFIERAREIADGRQLIFKLHPNEDHVRARREIDLYAPGALVFDSGRAEEMIANCDVFITRHSSTVFVAAALGKEVYSDLDIDEIKHLAPVQNNSGARNIAHVCKDLLEGVADRTAQSKHIVAKQPLRNRIKQLLPITSRRKKTAVGI